MNPGVVGECEPRIGAGRAPGAVKDRLCPTDGDAVIYEQYYIEEVTTYGEVKNGWCVVG